MTWFSYRLLVPSCQHRLPVAIYKHNSSITPNSSWGGNICGGRKTEDSCNRILKTWVKIVLWNCTISIPLGGTISSHFLLAKVGNHPIGFYCHCLKNRTNLLIITVAMRSQCRAIRKYLGKKKKNLKSLLFIDYNYCYRFHRLQLLVVILLVFF